MVEILRDKSDDVKDPFVIELIDVEKFAGFLTGLCSDFYAKWRKTHVVMTPEYKMSETGKERVLLQAIERGVWERQYQDNGKGQVNIQVGAKEAAEALQGGVQPAGAGQMPPAPPRGGKGLKGMFGG